MAGVHAESPGSARRQGVADLTKAIAGLRARQDRTRDFHVFTYPVVRQIGKLIEQLSGSDQESAACEVLRQVRDSFFDGGWNGYRDEKTRQGVIDLLERHLGAADVVSPAAVQQSFAELIDLGLRPVLAVPGLLSLAPHEETDDEHQRALPR